MIYYRYNARVAILIIVKSYRRMNRQIASNKNTVHIKQTENKINRNNDLLGPIRPQIKIM